MLHHIEQFLVILILVGMAIGYNVAEKMSPNEYATAYGIAVALIFCLLAGCIYHVALATLRRNYDRKYSKK